MFIVYFDILTIYSFMDTRNAFYYMLVKMSALLLVILALGNMNFDNCNINFLNIKKLMAILKLSVVPHPAKILINAVCDLL